MNELEDIRQNVEGLACQLLVEYVSGTHALAPSAIEPPPWTLFDFLPL
jgi:hypothetical protein